MSPGKKNIKSFKVVAGHQGVGEFDNEQKSECLKCPNQDIEIVRSVHKYQVTSVQRNLFQKYL